MPHHFPPAKGAVSDDVPAPARVVLDHELLWRLEADTPPAEWERTLRRTGLWSLAAASTGSERAESAHGEAAKLVTELVRTVEAWSNRPAPQPPSPLLPAATGLAFVLGFVAVVALVPAPANAVLTGVLAVAAGGVYLAGRSPEPTLPPEARRAMRLLRQLLGRTFVEIHGETVVENLPHRDYLQLRIGEIEAASANCDARVAEMTRTLDGIRLSNTRLGRPADDPETENLARSIEAQRLLRGRVETVRIDLVSRLQRFDAELERLRALAERRALSERAARLTEGAAIEESLRVASDIEVDVATIEAEVAGLIEVARHDDARLRSVLEVIGATRGASTN